MGDEIDPSASGQHAAAGMPNGAAGSEGSSHEGGVNPGIQKRIDELTAKNYDTLRQMQAAVSERDSQINQLTTTLAELAMRGGSGSQVIPAVEVDPEDQRKMDAMMRPHLAKMEQMLGMLSAQVGHQQFQQKAAEIGDPELAKEAQQLMGTWQKAKLSGWTSEDALIYAAGRRALEERNKVANNRDERGRFNGMANNVLTGHSAAPAPGNQGNRTATLPTNIDSLPADQRLALLEKHLDGKVW